jgi:sortase (surface protein transpeptidase)
LGALAIFVAGFAVAALGEAHEPAIAETQELAVDAGIADVTLAAVEPAALKAPQNLQGSRAPEPIETSSRDEASAEVAADEVVAVGPSDDVYPMRVRIPSIDVDADVIDLGLNTDGTLEVPSDFGLSGWYTGRSAPGELGPSVVVGHVDSWNGPAVFYRLRDLEAGNLIEIDRSDGLVALFRVDDVVLVDKDEFPTEQVYGATEQPTLRLITCGGGFDEAARSYLGNLIIYAQHLGNYPAPPDTAAS